MAYAENEDDYTEITVEAELEDAGTAALPDR